MRRHPFTIPRPVAFAGGLLLTLLVLAASTSAARATTTGGPILQAFLQLGPKLQGAREIGPGQFGFSVALSADGTTALVGGHYDDAGGDAFGGKGAAWVFRRSGSSWIQETKLTGGQEKGHGGFGFSVALSADGKTALIGAPYDDDDHGAVWVFTRSASTVWIGSKLTVSGGRHFGLSVALAANGNTALIGAPGDDGGKGAAWVFARSGSRSTSQGKLLGGKNGERGRGDFGGSVALSGDGTTALIGGPYDDRSRGAAWVFRRSASGWGVQGQKLTGAPAIGKALFGVSVALSGDGNTALVGGDLDDGGAGAAWIFQRSGATTYTQLRKLSRQNVVGGEIGAGEFGDRVALSSDGGTALVSGARDDRNGDDGRGAVWAFARSAGWAQQGPKLTGGGESGRGNFGWGLALSRDGATALIGGYKDSGSKGAAWAFVIPPPSVDSVSPSSGPTTGGTKVRLIGNGFADATAVWFGTRRAGRFTVESPSNLIVFAPPGAAGTVDVRVTTRAATSERNERDRFTYVAGPGIATARPDGLPPTTSSRS
jgi:FG-GAP repeat/IPT/TIG domain